MTHMSKSSDVERIGPGKRSNARVPGGSIAP